MFENATLHEAYTGSLIAGKGKLLNNIKVIMDRTRLRNEDWTRVRFGAGTPWRRCWCVITPPDEKEVQKQQKQLKKKSAYERALPLKGKIQFFDTKKIKKATPIATINDAYSAYAIYPQSKPLIDQSTLVKVEGSITIHSNPDITTEGFVFVMPEVHPAITGFEMMLRYLFPVYDIFALYGRPNRLIADTLDTRSLMFALPQERRYGYLEILDVAGLVHENGSHTWSEREWRKRLKDLTSARMTRMTTNGRPRSRASSYRDYRSSLPGGRTLRYEDGASIKSTPSLRDVAPPMPPSHTFDSEQPNGGSPQSLAVTPTRPRVQHQRSFSEVYPGSTPRHQRSRRERQDQSYTHSRLSQEQSRPSREPSTSGRPSYEQAPAPLPKSYDQPPPPPAHGVPVSLAAQKTQMQQRYAAELENANDRSSSESDRRFGGRPEANAQDIDHVMRPAPPPAQVAAPPAFSHGPGAKPQKRPGISPDLRRANSRLSITTLQQLSDAGKNSSAGGGVSAAAAAAAWRSNSGLLKNDGTSEDQGQRGVIDAASTTENTADRSTSAEGMVPVITGYSISNGAASRNTFSPSSQMDAQSTPYYQDKPLMTSYDLLSPQTSVSRNTSPLSISTTPSPPLQPPVNGHPNPFRRVPSQGHIFAHQSPPTPLQKPPPMPIDSQRPQPSRSSTSRSVTRKPVPSRTPPASGSRSPPKREYLTREDSSPGPPIPTAKSSFDSLHDRYIDEDALARVLSAQHTRSMTSENQKDTQDDDDSVYDNDSTVSPDYASTRKSTETKRSQRSVEKPRRGVLKTVGTVEPEEPKDVQVGDARYRPGATPEPQVDAAIPLVDFGPTQIYNPAASSRPTTSGTPTQATHERSWSSDRLAATPSPLDESPAEKPRSSVVPSEKQNESYQRPPSRNLTTPEPRLRGPSPVDDEKRRSIAWQPGAQIGGGSPGSRQSITPEQFVQQRAAANRITPIYAHGRQNSGSPTPLNVSRQSSGEWPIQQPKYSPNKLQKRHSSYSNDMPSRPLSRAASNLINVTGDYSNHLSAREQEHVARVTGSPLINMAGNTNKNAGPQGGGLIGAIEAREKEKKEIKEGLSGSMVQHAIAQRQHHNQQQRPQSHGTSMQQYATPTPQFAMPGGYPPSPGYFPSQPNPQQQYGWGAPQQQQPPYAQYQQQQQPQWTPPSAGQFVGPPQHPPYRQQSQHFTQNANQPGQHPQQGQQQFNGPYFGNGQTRQ